MKNIFTNPDEALAIIESFAEFDEISMKSIACMMVDTISAKYHRDSIDTAAQIFDAVISTNNELGAYHLPTEGSNAYV